MHIGEILVSWSGPSLGQSPLEDLVVLRQLGGLTRCPSMTMLRAELDWLSGSVMARGGLLRMTGVPR